ncbi:MAG TPA: DUF2855 family protein [Acidimicrobiia bacterium]|nr:DUF2855 family protein [Acidimicrobiia bacterium]
MNFEVDRADLHRTRLVAAEPAPVGQGDARLRVDAFALTSNNITYGALGDALQYWKFFPAADNWGRIPVWGFGEVVESNNASVQEGERVYGYFPMSDELVVAAGKGDVRGFTDLATHRQPMAAAYNRYLRVDADPIYDAAREGQEMVLWPLFFTSFMIDDSLADNEFFGASEVIISSASSKTAIGSAHLLHNRAGARVVGLTSAANRGFVEKLGCYDDAVTYGEVDAMTPERAVFIDIAGNRDVQAAIHRRFGDELAHSMIVGDTHWDHVPAPDLALVGPRPELFFAPTQIAKRTHEWGQHELDRRVGDAWRTFSAWTDGWLELRRSSGPDAVAATYHELLDGRSDPHVGHVCEMTTRS